MVQYVWLMWMLVAGRNRAHGPICIIWRYLASVSYKWNLTSAVEVDTWISDSCRSRSSESHTTGWSTGVRLMTSNHWRHSVSFESTETSMIFCRPRITVMSCFHHTHDRLRWFLIWEHTNTAHRHHPATSTTKNNHHPCFHSLKWHLI